MLCFLSPSSFLAVNRREPLRRFAVLTSSPNATAPREPARFHANAVRLATASPKAPSKRPRPTAPQPSISPTAQPSPETSDHLISELFKLANSRGALGRGVRATLRAFHRRTAFIISKPSPQSLIYVEIGPAYVLATAKLSSLPEHPTRYAVETRAWPALRALLKWEETTSTEARARGAVLRRLFDGTRFGRHLFLSYETLAAVVHVAEELIGDTDDVTIAGSMELEATVELKRRPLPGVRTVAVRCPRREQHSNGDRKPSLMLWMNPDGVTGGALCPVCVDHSTHESPPRNMTWRVHYLSEKTAALYTPRKRIRSPFLVQRAMTEYRRRQGLIVDDEDIPATQGHVCTSSVNNNSSARAAKDPSTERCGPIGGCVMTNQQRIKQVGEIIGMAYVTASLKTTSHMNTTGEAAIDSEDGTRLRTVGSMARQRCPMQVLLWSDRRSKGPRSAKRVEKVSSFARKSLPCPQWLELERGVGDGVVHSDEWLPTPLLSVSAMKPSGWRDVVGYNGRLVSLPASWQASAQAWVLFDIDDMQNLDETSVVTQAANKIVLAVRRDKELSGRCLVLQTGPNGLHVWTELREVRENPRIWFRKTETRAWYLDLGRKLVQAAHRGGASCGKIDMSSCSAGRFARRPGWRLLEDGSTFRSRVVVYVPSAVRNRKPRLL